MVTKKTPIKQDWGNASYEGSRRAMIRQSLKLSVRERLEALESLCVISERLSNFRKK